VQIQRAEARALRRQDLVISSDEGDLSAIAAASHRIDISHP
jgi:hypothetical protein